MTHHGICRAVDPMPRFQEVVNLDADALREAAEYLQLPYRKPHESEAYLSPGEWERRSRLVTIKVTNFEFEALSSLTEVTGLTKSRLMCLALARKAPRHPGIRQQRTPARTIVSSRESCFPMMNS
ncbi:MAG: hypothetical protein F4Z37_06700 [Rhodothermaceae bacterium]|nr:hypothetical protein [Rhodothermaceae bacterium]